MCVLGLKLGEQRVRLCSAPAGRDQFEAEIHMDGKCLVAATSVPKLSITRQPLPSPGVVFRAMGTMRV